MVYLPICLLLLTKFDLDLKDSWKEKGKKTALIMTLNARKGFSATHVLQRISCFGALNRCFVPFGMPEF